MGEDEETKRKRERDREYMTFKRNFDGIKREHDSQIADSEKMKQQANGFFQLGLYQQASLMYSDAIELNPENHVLYCNRSMAYLKLGFADQALQDAEKSLALDSAVSNIKAYWRKAQALLDLERFEESEAASDIGLGMQPANQHLNTVRRKAREQTVLRILADSEWLGKTDESTGGVEKRYKFCKDGTLLMHVFGHPIGATFELSVEGNPRSMYVKMKMEGDLRGTGPPPPPMPYIFEFHDNGNELWLCHPVGTNDLPTEFEGPGFTSFRRTSPAPEPGSAGGDGPLDERCATYIEAMNAVLPLMLVQLPEKPTEDEVAYEVQITEKMGQLKYSYGLQVHQRAVELAKNPSLADSPILQELARGLQTRLVARKIIPPPAPEQAPLPPEPAKPVASTSQRAPAAGCMGGLKACVCGGAKQS